jgi:sulfite exporter TauE/SafE/copper chaperone CopZ
MKRKELYVKGMHCPSCEIYIERELKNIKNISNVESDYLTQKVFLEIDNEKNIDQIIENVNKKIEEKGYRLQKDPIKKKLEAKDYVFPFIIASTISILFLLFQKSELLTTLNIKEVNLLTAFFLGLIASVSSCMAVVGGLIISLSAIYKSNKPLLLLHIARLLSFFLLGGILGIIGSVFTFSSTFYLLSGIVIFFVMFLLGINLLEIFPVLKKLQPLIPKSLTSNQLSNTASPLFIGFLTFFLPCGFTQSMQIYSMLSGSFLTGALTMFSFAIGTLPVLALISFGFLNTLKRERANMFLKTAGFLVLFLSIYNLMSLLISQGLIIPY